MVFFIELVDDGLDAARKGACTALKDAMMPSSEVKLLAPIPRPRPVTSTSTAPPTCLSKRDGEDASIFAAMQADERLEARDMEGGAVWRWVTRAVKELLDKNPPATDTAVQ